MGFDPNPPFAIAIRCAGELAPISADLRRRDDPVEDVGVPVTRRIISSLSAASITRNRQATLTCKGARRLQRVTARSEGGPGLPPAPEADHAETRSRLLDVPHEERRAGDDALHVFSINSFRKPLPSWDIRHRLERALLDFGGDFLALIECHRLQP
jgi:hypothetical protein